MKRREFITLFGGAVVVATSSAHAQQPAKSRRIGILETVSPALNIRNLDALRRGLRELGYIENQNYILEYRSADGDAERFPALADELVRLCGGVVVTPGSPPRPRRKEGHGNNSDCDGRGRRAARCGHRREPCAAGRESHRAKCTRH